MGVLEIILFVLLCISGIGLLVTGFLTILQFNGYIKKVRSQYVKYFIFFTIFTVVLMAVFVIMISLR